MKKFLGLRTQGFKVPDLPAAKKWYTQVFGVEPYFDEPFYVGFRVAGYEFGLLPAEEKLIPGNNAYTYWGSENIHEQYKGLLNMGATENEPPQDVGGGVEVATVLDPWGNIFGLIYNPHFKAE